MSITNGYELVHPDYYAENGPPYAVWDRLRAESPVHACEVDDIEVDRQNKPRFQHHRYWVF